MVETFRQVFTDNTVFTNNNNNYNKEKINDRVETLASLLHSKSKNTSIKYPNKNTSPNFV